MGLGFFTKEEINPPCGGVCKLSAGCHSPKMPVTGRGEAGVLIIAEAPGATEDLKNTQLIGDAGKVLRRALAELGVDLDRDCRKTNAVRCRPPENRRPLPQEITACAPHIWNEIKEHPPKVIILLGDVALRSFLLGRWVPKSIGQFRGFTIPDQKAGCWVLATFHPSYILRSQQGREIRGKATMMTSPEELIFKQDLARAIGMVNERFPIAPTPQWVEDWTIKQGDETAIDYETTGLRPYRKGHRIVSLGLSDGKWMFALPMSLDFARKWKLSLQAPRLLKIAHNMKFEHQWAAHCLGVETQGWIWDTMIAAHVLDNRGDGENDERHNEGITGLKLQVYLNFGVERWEPETRFKPGEFNDWKDREPSQKDLRYNALDSFWTKQLANKQRRLFK